MQSMQRYDRLCRVALEPTLALLRNAFEKRHRRSLIAGQEVNTRSLRLQTFAFKGVVCARCGLAATHFALERDGAAQQASRYHLNLWGVDDEGNEVLFTHDHIVPLGREGTNTLDNTQPMCGPCNWDKNDQLESELEAKPAAARYLSCEGGAKPIAAGFYEVSSTTCRSATPQFLEFDGTQWVELAAFREDNGGGDVRWLEGSTPRRAPPEFINPFAPRPISG
jgi:hypothetical protein